MKKGIRLASLVVAMLLMVSLAALAEPVDQLAEPIGVMPVLLTSVGQSADVEMVRVMFEKAGMECTIEKMATSADLGDYKTLILAVGGSSKGLGAAGINADQELERAMELMKAADEAGLVIIAMHVGGAARRGDLSDKFITPCFDYADYAIIVQDGDGDELMKGLATDKGIPFTYTKSMASCIDPLKAAFGQP